MAGSYLFARQRWDRRTRKLIAQMERARVEPELPIHEPELLNGLPSPVARYFEAVLRRDQPVIDTARLHQRGVFLLSQPDNWQPFIATESFTASPPGFVWEAVIRMAPAIGVRVRDSFVDGRGSMHASILGVLPIVARRNSRELAAASLMRYLAEAVWMPTALLPPNVRWTSVDDRTASASISAGETGVSLDFHFGDEGLIDSVYTPTRARFAGRRALPTPWRCGFSQYMDVDGVKIPGYGHVEWLLPEGPRDYCWLEITGAEFGVTATLQQPLPRLAA